MTDTVILKIKKLLALAQSANEHEAALAAARAQALMNEHNLSTADIDSKIFEADNPMGEDWIREDVGHYGLHHQWKGVLIHNIAKINSCFTMRYGRSTESRVKLIGRASDRQVVEYLACYLMREIERLAEINYFHNGYHDKRKLVSWTRSFGFGATNVILRRLREEKERFTVQHMEKSTALALRDSTALKEYMDQHYNGVKEKSARTRIQSHAYAAGRAAGERISWNSAVNPAPQNRRLSEATT